MKPVKDIPKRLLKAVFSDLDDTLTKDGRIPAKVIETLYLLKSQSFWLVIVSGRPAGWADCLMRILPLDAMIFENGAGLMVREGRRIHTHNLAPLQDLQTQRQRLNMIFENIKEKIPHLKLATDQPYRLFDYAIDFNEEPPLLTEQEVRGVMDHLSREKEITTKLSSIHINYWCGTYTKVTASQHLIETEGKKRGLTRQQIVFSGDSPNDEPLFEFFDYSVGVKNIEKYLSQMKYPPKFITKGESSEGFCELAHHLMGN